MSIFDAEIDKELKGLKSDQENGNMTIKSAQYSLYESLHDEMGKDIDDVLSGKVIVELSRKDKIKNFIKIFFQKI